LFFNVNVNDFRPSSTTSPSSIIQALFCFIYFACNHIHETKKADLANVVGCRNWVVVVEESSVLQYRLSLTS
jgi:hypothetical protein